MVRFAGTLRLVSSLATFLVSILRTTAPDGRYFSTRIGTMRFMSIQLRTVAEPDRDSRTWQLILFTTSAPTIFWLLQVKKFSSTSAYDSEVPRSDSFICAEVRLRTLSGGVKTVPDISPPDSFRSTASP